MALREFTYYLHDGMSRSEFQEVVLEDQLEMDEDEAESVAAIVGRPFYEVKLDCTLDTESGEVRIINVTL